MKKLLFILLFLLFTNPLFSEGFIAGTLVKTPNDYTSIDQLKKGARVLSLGPDGKLAENIITRIYSETVDSLHEIDIPNEKIYVSNDHLFLALSQKQWVEIQSLKDFDALANQAHECVDIKTIKQISQSSKVFTLTVEPNHNFFVTQQDILVHNWAITIPIFKFVFGGGLKILGLKALALLLGYQVLKEGVKHLAEKTGGDVSGFDTAGMPPMFDPDEDPEDNKNRSKGLEANLSRHPSTPVGRKNLQPGARVQPGINKPTVINGRKYSGHSLDRMQERGIIPSAVENTIRHGIKVLDNDPSVLKFYEKINNMTVVVNKESGRVISAYFGK